MKAQTTTINRCKLTSFSYSGGVLSDLLTCSPLLSVLLLGSTLLTTSCVSPIADPTEEIDTRQVADSTASDSARFTTTIKPWEPGGTIVGHRQ